MFYSWEYLTKPGKVHVFCIILSDFKQDPLFCLLLSLVSVSPISSLPTDDREPLIKAEEVIIPEVKNGSPLPV